MSKEWSYDDIRAVRCSVASDIENGLKARGSFCSVAHGLTDIGGKPALAIRLQSVDGASKSDEILTAYRECVGEIVRSTPTHPLATLPISARFIGTPTLC